LTVGSIFGSRSRTRQERSHLMIPGAQTVTMELWYISQRQMAFGMLACTVQPGSGC
jgi:hypothetical protein